MAKNSRRSFGSSYRKKRKNGTYYKGWFVRFMEAGRRVERGGFASKTAAETYLSRRRLEHSEARALGLPELRRITVADLVDEYIVWAKEHRRPNSVKSQGTFLRAFKARLGDRDAISIRGEDILQWIARTKRERGWKASTQHGALTAVGALYRYAIDFDVVRQTPTQGIRRRLPTVDTEEPPYLAPDELRRIYAAMPPSIRPCVILFGEAGLRRNEGVELLWSQVASDLSTITIRGDRSKSHRGRTVWLTDDARAALKSVRTAIPLRDARVFPDLTPHRLNDEFRAAADSIGRHDVQPKTLRHAFASGLVRAGVDLPTVQRLMGHKTIQMTMRYACHAPNNAAMLAIQALQASRRHETGATGTDSR